MRRLWIVLLLLILLAGCEKPGEGKRAEAGFAACEPLIAALEEYHDDYGAYPEALADLEPDYLADVPEEVNGYPIEYDRQPEAGTYALTTRYERPGMNICIYTSEGGWNCHGYY